MVAKIGILTFHNAYNYGAILQAFATQEIVKLLGYDVEVIDYHNLAIDKNYEKRKFHIRAIPKRQFYKLPLYILEKYFYRKRRKAFQRFISEHINLSKSTYFQGEHLDLKGYDLILIGSDQVWNKKHTGGLDDVYWGKFSAYKSKIVAWSVCMNDMDLNESEKSFVTDHLKNFDFISVRETSLQSFISNFTDKPIFNTLDPTIILSPKVWEHLCHEVKERNYIAVYAVRKENETIEFARKLSRIKGKPLVIIRSYSKPYFTKENKECGGPTDFLSYIRHADFVVSTSFHGTVFSLIFKRQFVCPAFEENVRVTSILKSVGLENRFIDSPNIVEKLESINYKIVDKTMEELKQSSFEFLEKVLQK